jgi:hypothetical protein
VDEYSSTVVVVHEEEERGRGRRRSKNEEEDDEVTGTRAPFLLRILRLAPIGSSPRL